MNSQPDNQQDSLLTDQPQVTESVEEVDPIAQLGARLYALEKAANLESSELLKPTSGYGLASQIIKRLVAVEELIAGDGSVPIVDNRRTITREEAANVSFLRRNKITIEDISSGRVRIR
jgi:hypothetical protein